MSNAETPDATDEADEYRPTDWLATCRLSYGIGHVEDQAIQAALQYAGPFDPDTSDTVTVAVWKLYADSWQSHSPRGPEREAEQLAFREYELPVAEADRVSELASDTTVALEAAKVEGETRREIDDPE